MGGRHHLQLYFSYVIVVSLIGRGKRDNPVNITTCRKSTKRTRSQTVVYGILCHHCIYCLYKGIHTHNFFISTLCLMENEAQ